MAVAVETIDDQELIPQDKGGSVFVVSLCVCVSLCVFVCVCWNVSLWEVVYMEGCV